MKAAAQGCSNVPCSVMAKSSLALATDVALLSLAVPVHPASANVIGNNAVIAAKVETESLVMFSATPEAGCGAAPLIVGVDEAGRGPLAGPVVAAAVVLCKQAPAGLADSKVLSAKRRALLDPAIRQTCAWAVGVVEPEDIDRLNIFGATMRAMTLAVERLCQALGTQPLAVLIDGNKTPDGRDAGWRWPARAIVGGDAIEPCISAASIVAKQWRDRIMLDAAARYPHYGWDRNKGYPTRDHLAALDQYGPCPLHRRSFGPVARLRR